MYKKLVSWYISRAAIPFWFIFVADCLTVYISGMAAFAINHSLSVAVGEFRPLLVTMLFYTLCFIAGFRVFHTYSGIIRKTTVSDLARIACALMLGVGIIMTLRVFTPVDSIFVTFRFRDLLLQTLIALSLMGGLRGTAKIFYDIYLRHSLAGGAYGYCNSDLIDMEMRHLLPREPIEVNMDRIRDSIHGHRIMITGAGGSIGSELARIIATFGPAELILVDQAETPLHDVRIYMERMHPDAHVSTLVTNICHSARMDRIFATHRPEIVFHAAAYKHVPMMEDNPVESVLNNIDGTRKLADLAVAHGVDKFVMISTDKAVNPTNVMGCSKRICEIYCQALSASGVHTQFVTTRFGNVLGSNGSVIPTFREQIRRGGPVYVTHPDVIRYFMLIPEACTLVLEAAAMGNGGEIYAFDMGSPVRIVDLARRMIMLSGRLNVNIEFTGLRPGEKLYEEVLTADESVIPTTHPKIWVAKVRAASYHNVKDGIDSLISIARSYDETETVRRMKQMVPEYRSAANSPFAALDHPAPTPPPIRRTAPDITYSSTLVAAPRP